jgi:hypothetical protein
MRPVCCYLALILLAAGACSDAPEDGSLSDQAQGVIENSDGGLDGGPSFESDDASVDPLEPPLVGTLGVLPEPPNYASENASSTKPEGKPAR